MLHLWQREVSLDHRCLPQVIPEEGRGQHMSAERVRKRRNEDMGEDKALIPSLSAGLLQICIPPSLLTMLQLLFKAGEMRRSDGV